MAAIAGKCARQSVRAASVQKNGVWSGKRSLWKFHVYAKTPAQPWKAASDRRNGW